MVSVIFKQKTSYALHRDWIQHDFEGG